MSNQVLEQLKQEYNETVERLHDLGDIIANCADIDTHHCGRDAENIKDWLEFKRTDNHYIGVDISVDGDRYCDQDARSVDRGNATVSSLKSLLGMQVIGVGQGKCEGCPQDHYDTPCVKVELIGGAYICLAPTPNTITE